MSVLFQHEDFSMNPLLGFPNDIGLLKLSKPADLSNKLIGLACIPTPDMGTFAGNPDTWITGWGLTSCNYTALYKNRI